MDAQELSDKPAPAKAPDTPDIVSMSDAQLLQMRICDLKLKIAGPELESRIDKFYAELGARNFELQITDPHLQQLFVAHADDIRRIRRFRRRWFVAEFLRIHGVYQG